MLPISERRACAALGQHRSTQRKLPRGRDDEEKLTADDPRMADDAIDTWLKPYERSKDTTKAMQEYLSWEVDLLARIERDGSARFASRSSAE